MGNFYFGGEPPIPLSLLKLILFTTHWYVRHSVVTVPDNPPIAAVHGCLYAMFQTKNAENPTSIPKVAYPILMYVLLFPINTDITITIN